MILQKWLQELGATATEQDVVSFTRSKLDRVETDKLPRAVANHPLRNGNDVREVAANLASLPTSASKDSDLLQQLLIVFSLATDRLSELERRGVVVRAPRGATSPG